MNKRTALFLTSALVFLFMGNYFFFSSSEKGQLETVIIARAIDGDTFILEDNRTIRLININTPEKNEKGYEEAKTFLSQFESKKALLADKGTEKYGRTLGRIYVDSVYINLELVKQGLAHNFLVDEDEIPDFFKAQRKAFSEQKGMWERSPFYDCLRAEIDKKEEYVRIVSSCASTLEGWTIKDETTHPYTIESPIADTFTLWSASGEEDRENRYWGRENVWNNDRDTLFIRDENELLVLYIPYGY